MSAQERIDAALTYRGRHRTMRGSLTMAAARRNNAAMQPAAIAEQMRQSARTWLYFNQAKADALTSAANAIDPVRESA